MEIMGAISNVCPKRLVPRYLYHITTVPVYEKICESKIITPNKYSVDPLRGVFMLELQNFFKRWNFNNNFGHCFQGDLLKYLKYKAKDGDLVMLRIPTAALDRDKLLIRSLRRSMCVCEKQDMQEKIYGKPAKFVKYYTCKREPIEYIYKDAVCDFQKIGQADSKIVPCGSIPEIREFFKEILKNTKEKIGAEKFICYNFKK